MNTLWHRLRRVLDAQFPNMDEGTLREGASLAAIEAAEIKMGQRFPDDIRSAYLHSDGVVYPGRGPVDARRVPPLILPFYDWAALEWVVSAWHEQCDRADWLRGRLAGAHGMLDGGRVRDGATQDKAWIPIGNAHMSTYVACDLNPGPAGTRGQLIKIDLEDHSAAVIGRSFSEYIARLLDCIESGALFARRNTWIDARTGEMAFSLPCP